MSFIRRFSSMPSAQTISQIEGIVIVDAPPPAPITGVSTGVVGAVGEFADMTYAVSVDGYGNVTTKPQPYEITSSQDMANKFGGWDATIGEFGGDDGNGYTMLNGKRFSRLVICPVNLASSKGVRVWRSLPTNTTTAQPVYPIQPATVEAGREFSSGGDRVKLAKTVNFSADLAFVSALTGGQGANSGSTQAVFQDATKDFAALGVKVGDALVLGITGGSGAPGTYRIIAVGSTTLTVEQPDGAAFTWLAVSDLPYRIHPGRTFDSGAGFLHDDESGYLLPARPLDATISGGTTVDPTITPESGSALAGLQMGIHPDGLTYTAAVQAENAATTSALEALYTQCFESLLVDDDPVRDISILIAARTSTAIRTAMRTHVVTASSQGRGRMAVIAPALDMVSKDTAIGNTADGVGYNRDERVIYCWPGVQTRVSAAVDSSIKKADGTLTVDGLLDVRSDAYMASILSNLASERNPGQASDPVPLCLDTVLSFQSGLPGNGYSMADYINFRQYGVAALRFERGNVKTFQSGITTSLDVVRKNINRRRMADEVQDSLAQLYEKYNKLPLTNQLKTTIDSETTAYLAGLLSAADPSAQRIEAYSVDSKSGNTPELNAAGIYVVVVKVRMLGMSDSIVLQAEVGPTVTVTAA